jgi:hypothetical protein
MKLGELYDSLRVILGDRKVYGNWNYKDETLGSALRTVFLLGRGPANLNYQLNDAQDEIDPALVTGDDYAIVCYEAALLLIVGEDGEMRIHTRSVSLVDGGHRKRDLMVELREKVYQIRDGAAVFATVQTFVAYINSIPPFSGPVPPLADRSEVNVTPMPSVTL